MDPRELVQQAFRCEAEGRLDDARLAWLAVARLIPGEPDAYRRLFDLHVHRREVDAAFCAASVLASLDAPDALDGMARELYEDYCPRRLPPRVAGVHLDADDWALLRHPLEDAALGERLAATLPKLRLPTAQSAAIDMATLAWAGDMLGASAEGLPRDGAPEVAPRADLDEVWGNYTLRERLFFAGRAATALRFPVHRLLGATPKAIAEALGTADTEAIEAWTLGVKLTRARAGMLVCGEPAVARALLVRESALDAVLGELALFAVSAEHHRLRAKLGIAIGMAADAPAAAVPASIPPFAPTALARTTAEMALVASLQPCPACGASVAAANVAASDFHRDGERWRATVACPRCRGERAFVFAAKDDPSTAHCSRWDLGDGTSSLLSTSDLLRALDVAMADMPRAIDRAMACIIELGKMPAPEGATDERLTKPWRKAELARLWKMVEAARPPRSVPDSAIDAHRAWLANGAKGAGQLVLENRSLRDEKYDDLDWSLARIADCDLTNVILDDTRLQLAQLHRVTLTDARGWSARLPEAQIRGGRWTFADLARSSFLEADIEGTDFSGSTMYGVDFRRARVRGAKLDGVAFGNTLFDGAEFEACTFRYARLAKFIEPEAPTSADARFVDCDFTGVDWSKRDLSNTTFVRCKLAGARGQAHYREGLVLEACDVELGAFPAVRTSDGSALAAIEAMLQRAPRTVGELMAAFGATVGDDAVRAMPGNTFAVPPALSGSYEDDGDKPTTAQALSTRRLALWKLDVVAGLRAIEAPLEARFGVPIVWQDTRRYGAFSIAPAPRTNAAEATDAGALFYDGFAFSRDPVPALRAIAVSPDGGAIAVGDAAGRLRVWRPDTQSVTGYFLLGFPILKLAWTSDGERLVAISDRRHAVDVFSADGSKHLAALETESIADLALHPSKPLAATTGSDGVMRVWDLATGQTRLERTGLRGRAIAMSETHVVVAAESGEFSVWELETGKEVHAGNASYDAIDALSYRADGKRVVFVGREGSLVEMVEGSWEPERQSLSGPANAIAFAPPPAVRRFVCTHRDGSCSLFHRDVADVPTRLAFTGAPGSASAAASACFVPSSQLLLVAHHDGRIRVWRMGEGTPKIGEIALDDHVVPKVVDPVDVKDLRAWWGVAMRAATKTCAVCRAVVAPGPHAGGLGEDCPSCGHIAPDVSVAYPSIAVATAIRDELLALRGKSRAALRCLAIANLFDSKDLRAEEEWGGARRGAVPERERPRRRTQRGAARRVVQERGADQACRGAAHREDRRGDEVLRVARAVRSVREDRRGCVVEPLRRAHGLAARRAMRELPCLARAPLRDRRRSERGAVSGR